MSQPQMLASRRRLLALSAAALAMAPFAARAGWRGAVALVEIESFDASGMKLGVGLVPKVAFSEDDWRKRLSPAAFNIARRAGTEIAFTGAYWDSHKDGLFRCVCCATALFDS